MANATPTAAPAAPAPAGDKSGVTQALEEAAVYYEQAAKQFREAAEQLKPVDPAKGKQGVADALKSVQAAVDKMKRLRQLVEDAEAMAPPVPADAAHPAGAPPAPPPHAPAPPPAAHR